MHWLVIIILVFLSFLFYSMAVAAGRADTKSGNK
jgi:hypothetical protein